MTKTSPQPPITTTPAPTAAVESTAGTIAAGSSAPVAPTNSPPIADLDPAAPAQERANVSGLAVLRLSKALGAASIVAGRELAGIERGLGDGFARFIMTKTMLTVVEARALIRFATQADLRPEGLSAAVDVPLARVLTAVALLGRLFVEQQTQSGAADV